MCRVKIEEEKEEEEEPIVEKLNTKDEEEKSLKENYHNQSIGLKNKICFCDRAPSFSQSSKPPPHLKSSYCLSESSGNLRSKASIVGKNSHPPKNKSFKLMIEELKDEKLDCHKIGENNFAKGDCDENIFNKDRLINKSVKKIGNNQNKIEIASKYERPTIPTKRTENPKNRVRFFK